MDKRLAYHAQRVGLVMVDPQDFAIERRKRGRGFSICFSDGDAVSDARLKERVEALGIPPAWKDVRICVDEDGHIQAIGRDEKGRLQYRYHDRWVEVRNAVKTERLLRFGRALPVLRRRVDKDLRRRKLDRALTAATATRLIDVAVLRPGHEKYAEDGGRGVASLRKNNLRIGIKGAKLKFVGKSRKQHEVEITDKRLVKTLARIREGKGQRLFRFPDAKRKSRRLTATHLNDYLHEAARARISAKDFRTFHGSAEALRHLVEEVGVSAGTEAKKKRAVAGAMRVVSELLRNTPAVARASYVHPAIVTAFEEDKLSDQLFKGKTRDGLTRVETGLMRFLESLAPEEEQTDELADEAAEDEHAEDEGAGQPITAPRGAGSAGAPLALGAA